LIVKVASADDRVPKSLLQKIQNAWEIGIEMGEA
jgi:hypothetical protein